MNLNIKSLLISAVATLLSLAEVIEAIERNFVANNLFILGDDRCRWVCLASQGPCCLISEEQVGFAAIDNSVVSIVSLHDLIVSISEEEEADLAL